MEMIVIGFLSRTPLALYLSFFLFLFGAMMFCDKRLVWKLPACLSTGRFKETDPVLDFHSCFHHWNSKHRKMRNKQFQSSDAVNFRPLSVFLYFILQIMYFRMSLKNTLLTWSLSLVLGDLKKWKNSFKVINFVNTVLIYFYRVLLIFSAHKWLRKKKSGIIKHFRI